MQIAFRVACKAEWLKQRGTLARECLGDQLADADHLVAVVGIGDDVAVVVKHVEHRTTQRMPIPKPQARNIYR